MTSIPVTIILAHHSKFQNTLCLWFGSPSGTSSGENIHIPALMTDHSDSNKDDYICVLYKNI